MKSIYSHQWLQAFFDEQLPSPEEVSEKLLKHSFEVEEMRKTGSNDAVYELDILPDRSVDCLAHYGIAKEIAAIFSLPLKKQYFQEQFLYNNTAEYIHTEKCNRYTILKVENISLSETPVEIQKHLESIGQRCINPIVDLSNYILFDIGQPIHTFDAQKTSGQFRVRQAQEKETIVLLGNEEIVLQVSDVVIADAADNRAIALAGIKGGEKTRVDENTKDIYIEIASFDSVSVRRTMRRTGYTSDAALRFSQGLPPVVIGYTAQRVAEVFGAYGSIINSVDHHRVSLPKQRKTGVSVTEVNNLLGNTYTQKEIASVLDRLGFSYEYVDPRKQFITAAKEQIGKPYKWGASVSRDAPNTFDCSSFVCWCAAQAGKSIPRMSINQYFFATPTTDPQPGDIVFSVSSDKKAITRNESVFEEGFPVLPGKSDAGISHVGILLDTDSYIGAQGGKKVMISKITNENIVGFGRIWNGEERFVITVPVERPDIQNENDIIEEVGRILGYDTVPSATSTDSGLRSVWMQIHNRFFPKSSETHTKRFLVLRALQKIGFSEVMTSSFCVKDKICVSYPVAKDKGCLRSSLRPGIEKALEQNAYNGELVGLDTIQIAEIGSIFTEEGEKVHLALGVQETVGRTKANITAIEKMIRQVVSMPGSFENGVWEVALEEVQVHKPDSTISPISAVQYVPPSKYPFILRDVAVFVPNRASVTKTEALLQKSGGDYLQKINLFDSFEKDGKQSHAFRLVFQSDSKTLDDEVVNKQMNIVYEALKQNGYEVR